MTEEKVSAIVLSSRDYKEKDKLVDIFCLESGVRTVVLKGVKNSNAKFKFAKEPFCFGEFILTGNNEIKTVTQVNLIDTFFDITKDFSKFSIGCKILTLIKVFLEKLDNNSSLFVETLKALRELAYSSSSEKMILASYVLKAFSHVGYRLNDTVCSNCSSNFIGNCFLNLEDAELVCLNCRKYLSVEVDKPTHNAIRILSNTELESMNTVSIDDKVVENVLKVLQLIIQNRFSNKISILKM